MKIAFDAKRYYHNHRGLGNYSRDVIRLLDKYEPDWTLQLVDKSGLARSFMHVPECDIYHGLSGELPFGITHAKAKSIVTMHDAIFVRYPELYSPTYRWLFTQKVKYACQAADRIIAISEQTKRDMIEFFHADEKKIHVVYQGCNYLFRQVVSDNLVAKVKTEYALPDKYLLDVGAIEPRKNLHALICAIASAKIDLPLVVIGAGSHGDYAKEARWLAHDLKVKLIFCRNVSFGDFPAIYKGAHVLCYPSIFEGFGIPILEAMCVGTPVLTSTGSCFGETGGDAALYADPYSVEEIGCQLARLVEDEALRKQQISKGYAQAELFSDERVATNLINQYQSLL